MPDLPLSTPLARTSCGDIRREPVNASSSRGIATSIAFWICLMLSAAGYATATLTSEVIETRRLTARLNAGHGELMSLAARVDRYERYCDQLEQGDRSAAHQSVSREILVDPRLQFHLDDVSNVPTADRQAEIPGFLLKVHESAGIRRLLILVSAGLLAFAFTFLVDVPHDEPAVDRSDRERPRLRRRRRGLVSGRYRSATCDTSN